MSNSNPVTVIPGPRCWELLAGQQVGRLATAVDRSPDIFPVNFVVDGESLVFRTAEGSKLFALTVNSEVAFEVDAWGDTDGWSVVVRGTAEAIEDYEELLRVEQLPLLPFVPTVKQHYVKIVCSEISGRHFAFGPEPERSY